MWAQARTVKQTWQYQSRGTLGSSLVLMYSPLISSPRSKRPRFGRLVPRRLALVGGVLVASIALLTGAVALVLT